MYKKLLLFSCMAFFMLTAKAAYVPVALTGYNFDGVCNGSGLPTASATGSLDNQGYWLMDSTYVHPTYGAVNVPAMPTSLSVTSALDPNVQWQLRPYTGNNVLRIENIGTDSLVFQTAQAAAELYILYTNVVTGSNGNATITINFTDGSSQVSSANAMVNWFGGSANMVKIIGGRLNNNSGGGYQSNNTATGGPLLYQFKISLLAINYAKTIRSVKFDNNVTGNLLNVFAITLSTPCSGTVSAGAATASASTVCPSINFNLSLPTASSGGGITYQWQSSTTGSAPWSNISGATTSTYAVSQTVATSYRAYVVCPGGNSDTSSAVAVGMSPVTSCYCTPTYSLGGGGDNITNVVLGTLSNNTAAAANPSPYYVNYTSQQPTPIAIPALMQGQSYPLSLTFGTDGTQYNGVWIDFNQDGTFGTTEYFTSGSATSGSGTTTVTINIPPGATLGVTRMRIRGGDDSQPNSGQACGASGSSYGEAEDYLVRIISNLPCTAPATQPTALILTPAVNSVTASFTASTPAADGYLVLRTPGTATPSTAPVNATAYTVGATLGNATVVSVGAGTSFTDATVIAATQYRYTVYGYSDLCSGGPTYNVTTPLTATTTTNSATVYTWNGNLNSDWQIAGNWTPTRTTPDPTDVLQFNNGINNTVTNIPTQTISRLVFTNNTTAGFAAQTGGARTLTLTSDNNAATNELGIAAGSVLSLNGTGSALTMAFSGTGTTGSIAGTLDVSNTGTVANLVNFTNAIDTVTATGTLSAGGTLGTSVFTSTSTNLCINGTYNHKYTTVGGGAVPTATWGGSSNVLISGYTTSTGGPSGGLGQTFSNFTYNAPAQTANSQWSGTIPTTINGTLSVISTGTSQWSWSATTTYTVNADSFVQTGGMVDFGTGASGTKVLNIGGIMNQSAGILKASGTGAVTINFNGTGTAQNVSLFDSSVTGPIVYRVTNASGINLTGTGALATTPVFKINNGGGVQITSTATNAINTILALNYAATGTTLTYDGAATQAITSSIWPVANGPLNVTVNNSGTAPANLVTMPGSRLLNGTLTMSNGILVLGNSNLTLTNNATGAISISSPGAGKMIAADGAGQLIRAIGTTAGTSYTYPIGDLTGATEYSPAVLTFSSTGARLVGVRVVNAHHPSDASANYLNRYWPITDTATSAYTYSGNFAYTTADITGTEASLRLSAWNGTAWSQIPSLPNAGVLTIQGPVSSAFLALGGKDVTARSQATSNIYTWNGSVSTDYQVAGNWTPARNIPDPGDILQFNNAIVDTVKNIPTQTVTRITFTNNTTGVFQTAATNTLTFMSDNLPATNELDIAAGSSLISNGTSALTLAFSGTGSTVNIAGLLESVSNSVNNVFNFTNAATVTITSAGTLAAGGSFNGAAVTGTTATNFQVNGLFNYKYTTNTVGLPTASWNTGSTLLISGYTTVTGGPSGGQNQAFYNLTYNCPNQTSTANWSGTGATTVLNNLTVASTGTGSWIFSNGSGYTANIGNFIQTGGTFNTNSAAATAPCTFNISGTFNQTGGTFTCAGASTGANAPVLNFNGTAVQNVNFFNAAPVGPFNYRVSNPAGINLTGSGTLTGAFNINSNGGVRISSVAANPINTTLALTYAATATTLTYDPAGSAAATAAVWPATSGPLNVTLNTGGSANVIGVPFSRTIAGTLTMTSGDFNLGANTLTLGTAPATTGTLTYGAGNIRVTTGTFNRYYGTASLPTAPGNAVGFYPIANTSGANRNVALYFSVAGAFSTGGAIAVGHTDANGLATVAVTDGAYNITNRTNAAWNFAATGVVLSGTNTIGMRLTGTALFTSSNPANLRVMQPAAVVGTHVAGAGVSAQRSGMVVTDLTSPYHIGANASDIGGTYIAINTGNWSTPATWLNNLVPGVTNEAFINPSVNVTADAATNTAKALTILPGGTLTVNSASSTVTIDSAMQNNGTVTVGGGTLIVNGNSGLSGITNNIGALFNVSSGTTRLGPINGGNKPFANNGTLTVSGGTLNINGNLALNANSTFNQSGGNINVDGNAGGVVANSVQGSTRIVNILTPNLNLTDGVFTIVDPHVGANTNTLEYNVATLHVNASGNHTFRAGDGVSTDTGYNASYGMSVNTAVTTGRLAFKNVVVNSGTAANSWLVLGAGSTGVLGNFTVNTGGEYRQGGTGSIVYIAGNLVNNGTYSALGTTYFGTYASGAITSATAAQSVTGTGTFRNLLTAPTGKFYKIQVNNNANVTLNIGDVPFSNNVTMTAATAGPSRLIMASNSILNELGGAGQTTSATAGWIVGRYQKTAGSTGGFNGTFPVGDLNYYTPVNIGSGTVVTTGAIWASTTSTDHPNIATSNIAAPRTVNRFYTIQPVGGLTFAAGTVAATFNWNAADVDAGATPANFKVGRYANTTWIYPTTASPAATSIQITGLDTAIAGEFQVGETCSPVNITTPPANQVACLGSSATFSIGLASPSNVTYQWQKGTTNIPGATGATYTIPAVAAGDVGSYRVVLGSACPSVTGTTSTAATLTINTPATITTQPAATQNICEGSPVTFTVGATGTGIAYEWQKNGGTIAGATSASYTIPEVAAGDAGNYTVIVKGTAPCGNVTSSIAVLTVKPLPLTITAGSATSFCPGGSVALCASTTPATLTYQWLQNGSALTSQTNACFTATTGANYSAVITNSANGCSDTSNVIAVNTTGAPQSVITPANAAAFCQGSNITLHGLNTPGLTYKWFLNGDTTTAVGTDSTLVTNVAGSYRLRVFIGAGCYTTSSPTVVTINPLPTVSTTPTGNQAVCVNDTLTMTALFSTGNPAWRRNGTLIPGATTNTYKATTAAIYTVTVTDPVTGCSNTSAPVTLTLNTLPTVTMISANAATFCAGGRDTLRARPSTGLTYLWNRNTVPVTPTATDSFFVAVQSGSYTVTVTNSNGCRTTSAPIVVTANPRPDVIITPSIGLNICQGQTTNLCVPTATNTNYVWRLNGAPITGATSACYGASAAGNYSVVVTSTSTGCKDSSVIAAVTVSPVPVATATARGATTACVGDTVWIDANTGANLTYEWRINGNIIPGATSSSYGATATGSYTARVINGSNCGTTSTAIAVTVNPRPTANITYTTPVTFCEGGAVVLTGVSNTGTTYQWQNNGAPITGATNNNYIASATGSYSVIITNALGCSTVSPTILVVSNPLPTPVITRNGQILTTGSYATYQWYFNSQPIPGATNQSYNATQNGGYAVAVTDANGCTNYSTVYFLNNVGVGGPLLNAASVKVYPNPVRNTLNIEAPAQVNVIIRDLTGREVLNQENAKQMDMSKLADGAYMLMISDKNGNMIKTNKVMKVSE